MAQSLFKNNRNCCSKVKPLARINVYEELASDPRFVSLTCKIQRHEAFGSLVCLWEQGQSYWRKDRSLIPSHIAERLPNISQLIEVGFVEKTDVGYYCAGAKERWEFLLAMSENGKKSAEARRKKYGTAAPTNASNNRTKTEPTAEPTAEPKPNKTEPSSSSSSSKRKNTNTTEFDFESLYKKYPRHEGKAEGMRRARERIKDQEAFTLFTTAVFNYIEKCKLDQTDQKFIKHWSSFIGTKDQEPWRDYVEWQPQAKIFGCGLSGFTTR